LKLASISGWNFESVLLFLWSESSRRGEWGGASFKGKFFKKAKEEKARRFV
jgi:hypothetical protein